MLYQSTWWVSVFVCEKNITHFVMFIDDNNWCSLVVVLENSLRLNSGFHKSYIVFVRFQFGLPSRNSRLKKVDANIKTFSDFVYLASSWILVLLHVLLAYTNSSTGIIKRDWIWKLINVYTTTKNLRINWSEEFTFLSLERSSFCILACFSSFQLCDLTSIDTILKTKMIYS